jgi:hypothetical protein
MSLNAFVRGIGSNSIARTDNGAATLSTSGSALVDFFFVAGAARKMTESAFIEMFAKAYAEDRNLALRTSLYTRDVRGGVGEREAFRRILRYLDKNDPDALAQILPRVPELGRWDDLLVVESQTGRDVASKMIRHALLVEGNGLCAKWMPRKGIESARVRDMIGLTNSPKRYRKLIVRLSNTVEQKMCSGEWEAINLEHVPSVASSRYRKAFHKHLPDRFVKFVEAVKKGEAKVHASAIFPHDVIKNLLTNSRTSGYGLDVPSQLMIDAAQNQWNALPDFVGEGSFLPIIDSSGSMTMVGSHGDIAPIHVATSLGLYLSERNKSAFKNLVMTFSDQSHLVPLVNGNIYQKVTQMYKLPWGGSTNLQAAFKNILQHAKDNDVPAEDMPKSLLIISDMQFNACVRDLTNFEAMAEQYRFAGYEMPNVIFWNVNAKAGNNPVDFKQKGAALVSGMSPAIVKTVLSSKVVRPIDIVLEAVNNPRYDLAR